MAWWGIAAGWLIMPHKRGATKKYIARTAYIVAVVIGFAIANFFGSSAESRLFLTGMAIQYGLSLVFIAAGRLLHKI